MGNTGTNQSYDEKLASFYLEKLCLEADLVYRFAYVITLNRDEAMRCVTGTYTQALRHVSELVPLDNHELKLKLFSICLEGVKHISTEYPLDETGLAKLLAEMDVKTRITLMLVDAGAMTATELCDLLSEDETAIRRRLGKARKRMIELHP